ncbi:uncharacterized protein LOC123534012 isoform X2 [Mercenaria mercenaria]|uniref:uncharacterized protein LOC123534012 isoform X2 n=1 Tax=Mercenaria mercenaria TaxID=6596 RepID=UPI00234EBCF2|nr:uncharacterized protein LOC123534012 isoform X2 [Mercenaria mercenaria]
MKALKFFSLFIMAEAISANGEENCSELRQPEKAQTGENGVTETTGNGINQCDDCDLECEDIADGFITQYILSPKGTYSPREHEKESWGSDVDHRIEQEDQHDAIYQLLKNTTPGVRWREGLFYMLKENKSEASTRKCLAFLHSNALNGIKALEKGHGESVHIENNPAPKCLTCPDWMMVMEGLNFDLTSPGAVRDIAHVDVTVGKKTDTKVLTGFCHLMKAMLDMTWTNLRSIPCFENIEGQCLHDTLAALCSGYGIDESDGCEIEEMGNKYPFLMKSLGFRRTDKHSRLQWQRPDPDKEFQCFCLTFQGLFRSADKMESVL